MSIDLMLRKKTMLPATDITLPLVTTSIDFRQHEVELRARSGTWTQSAVYARECPAQVAVLSGQAWRSFGELHANANRLASAMLSSGVGVGDAVAVMTHNRIEFVEIFLAAMRIGARLTPVNAHLGKMEANYIVRDCEARLLFVESAHVPDGVTTCQNVVIGTIGYDEFLKSGSPADLQDPVAGSVMLYTSGTTGNPKGVYRNGPDTTEPQFKGTYADYRAGDVQMCCGPVYHSAPLLFDIRWPLASGVPIVLVDKWDSNKVLNLMAMHRVSHTHMVPTMFQRLLEVSPSVRQEYDLKALRSLVHGASPCSVQVKQAMIDWLGPVLTEYYGATEGGEGINVSSRDWLNRPGTVGRLTREKGHRILDEGGLEVPPRTVGRIFLGAPATGRFSYFGDTQKTAAAYTGNQFTLGDMGYVDENGWLFLTGRTAEVIIAGGVNIYPREVDDAMQKHPAIADVCTIGAPDDQRGERVVCVVVLRPHHQPSDALAKELIHHAETLLAKFKCPREVVFDTELPHTATGKLLRNQVRERFWQKLGRSI